MVTPAVLAGVINMFVHFTLCLSNSLIVASIFANAKGCVMPRKIFSAVALTFLVGVVAFAQTSGKLSGRVTDRDTKEPLVGANILVEGTNLGAATDLEGRYVILNVPVGTYSLTARYVGYGPVTVTDVKVIVGFTTDQNFSLVSEELELEPIIVSAERPLVVKDQPGTVRVVAREQIQALPIRGFVDIAALTAGVVQGERGGDINIRGGRTDETAYIVDGVWTNDPLTGRSSALVSQRSVEEIVIMTGGYSAEYGNVMSGVVNLTTRSGTPKYTGMVEAQTDEFLGNGAEGLRNTGFSLYNLSLSGPVIPTNRSLLQFYLSTEYQFSRDPNPSWNSERLRNLANELWEPFVRATIGRYNPSYRNFYPDDSLTAEKLGLVEPSWNGVRPGQMPDRGRRQISWNGKLSLSIQDLRAYFSAIGSRTEGRVADASFLLANSRKHPLLNTDIDQYTVRTSWTPRPKTLVEGQVSYFRNFEERMDPQHRRNVFAYGDTLANPDVKYYFPRGGSGQGDRVPFDHFLSEFALPNRVGTFYLKNNTTFWQFNLNVTNQIDVHELKFGGELRLHELRKYITRPAVLARLDKELQDIVNSNPDALTPEQREIVLARYRLALTEAYGYDFFVREIEKEGFDPKLRTEGPKKPIFGAGYIQDKIELEDFIINLGLRYDYWDANTDVLKDINNISNKSTRLGRLHPDSLDNDSFEKSKPFTRLSPRLGFSFPVTDRTVFFAQYGVFSQMPPLERLYVSREWLRLMMYEAAFHIVFANPRLEPERTTQYEIGVRQQVGEVASLNLTAYYKEITGLIQSQPVFSDMNPRSFTVFINSDYATVRGFDVTLDMRRWRNLAATLNYTLSDATGTGSDPFTQNIISWMNARRPKFESPVDFDQRHTLTLNLDYRFGIDAPALLREAGANVLLRANSGRPYTLQNRNSPPNDRVLRPQSGINAVYSGWNYTIDMRLNKRVSLAALDFDFYVSVQNLLNTKNTARVWPSSGRPDESGHLTSEVGQSGLARFEGEERVLYEKMLKMYELNPFNVSPPRMVRLGVLVEF